MDIEFDPAKNEANLAKHGVTLSAAVDFEVLAYVADDRFAEPRFRLYGLLGGAAYCLSGTERGARVRVISLRRAHAKEWRRYVE